MLNKWKDLKAQETEIIRQRRMLEDDIFRIYGVGTFDNVKIEQKITTKVDPEIVKRIGGDYEKSFRIKMEVNKKNYDQMYDAAITTEPARPYFSLKDDK